MLGYDWHYAYRPAALALLAGQSPYGITSEHFSNPPWTLLPLLPLALLPERIGWLALVVIGLIAFALTAVKLGASPVAFAAFLLSPLVIRVLYFGQIEWLALLGILFPPWLGLFFVLVKPQVGIGVALFWLVEAWRLGGLRQVVTTFAPVTIALLASFAVFGFWPINGLTIYRETRLNISLWPWGIVLGELLLARAWRKRDIGAAVAAGPMLSPYVGNSFVAVMAGAVRYERVMVVVSAALWMIEAMT